MFDQLLILPDELSDICSASELPIGWICPFFSERYALAKAENALSLVNVYVLVRLNPFGFYKAIVRTKNPQGLFELDIEDNPYGKRAGFIVSPNILRGKIAYGDPTKSYWEIVEE